LLSRRNYLLGINPCLNSRTASMLRPVSKELAGDARER